MKKLKSCIQCGFAPNLYIVYRLNIKLEENCQNLKSTAVYKLNFLSSWFNFLGSKLAGNPNY